MSINVEHKYNWISADLCGGTETTISNGDICLTTNHFSANRTIDFSKEVIQFMKNYIGDKSKRQSALNSIKKVIFNDPATIVYWADGTKTVVKCDYSYEKYDKEKGLAMAIAKKHFDNEGYYYDVFKRWIPELNEPVENDVVHNVKVKVELDKDGLKDALDEWWESNTTEEQRKNIDTTLKNLKGNLISAKELEKRLNEKKEN